MLTRIIKAAKRPPTIEVVWGPKWHTRVRARNGEILFSSEVYFSESNAWRAAHNLAALTGWKIVEVPG